MTEAIGEWVKISALEPWKDNPRQNKSAIDEVAKSIKRFGFASPIIARTADKMIIAGHTRYEAAKKLGLKKVPVRFMDLDLNDAQLLALADNKIGEIADWDASKLKDVIVSLQEQDLSGLGWSDDELTALLAEQTNYDDAFDENSIEDIEDLPEGYVSQVQLYFDQEQYELFTESIEACKKHTGHETREEVLQAVMNAYLETIKD